MTFEDFTLTYIHSLYTFPNPNYDRYLPNPNSNPVNLILP